jgi:hypothetical protein
MNEYETSHATLAHDYYACKERYDEIVGLSNLFKLISLAILPGIVLIAAQIENPVAIRIGLGLVSIGSVPTWIWEINSAIRGHERQKEACSLVIRDGRRVLGKLTDAIRKNDTKSLQPLSDRANEMHDHIISESVFVSGRIDILAQQTVMRTYGYTCMSCNSSMELPAVMTMKQIGRLIREAEKGKRCKKCLQVLPYG